MSARVLFGTRKAALDSAGALILDLLASGGARGQRCCQPAFSSSAGLRRRYDQSAFGGPRRPRGSSSPAPWAQRGGARQEADPARWQRYAIGAAAAGLVWAANREAVPGTNRSHFILLPHTWERALGEQALAGLRVGDAQTDVVRQRRVEGVVARLVAQVPAIERLPAHREAIDWRVHVVRKAQPNAMAAPGGQIVVFTGLMDLVRSDDELAGIVAHEMAHVLARHTAEQLTRNAFVVAGAAMVEALTGLAAGGNLVASVANLALTLPNSRRCESEADAVGVALAARACYDPEGLSRALQALERLEQRQGGGTHNAYLSTHPATAARVHATRELAQEARRTLDLGECEQYRQALRWGSGWAGGGSGTGTLGGDRGGAAWEVEVEQPPSGGWQ